MICVRKKKRCFSDIDRIGIDFRFDCYSGRFYSSGNQTYAPILLLRRKSVAPVALLTAATLWLLLAMSVAIWIWAVAFNLLGAFETLEEALYFSMVSFTTLGFGDVTLPQECNITIMLLHQ